MRKWFAIFCFSFFLIGCNKEGYTSVPVDKDVIITTNIKEGSISFIDMKTDKLLTTWELNETISGVTFLPDGDRLLVYGKQLEYIYVYSLKEGKQINKWETGKGIANILLSDNQKELFIADQNENAVRVFTIDGQETARVAVGQGPLTMVQKDNLLHVLNFYDTKLSTIDINEKKVSQSFMVPPASTGATISEDGSEILIGGHGDGEQVNEKVLIYSLQDGQMIRSLHAPYMPVFVSQDEKYIYVLSHGSNMLRKFDKGGYKEVGSLEVGSNPFSFWQDGEKGYVASYDSNEVYVIDLHTMKVKESIAVGKGPFQVVQREGKKHG
ncbi:YncE family protein [Bacillus manliponensis]|uniref:YncE family protein n=1 Tax=Bacillus manliponensis TaxID=574376 RepID=UPI0035140A54